MQRLCAATAVLRPLPLPSLVDLAKLRKPTGPFSSSET